MKIATFNVNGVNGRLPVLLRWLAETKPDVVCLQELKAPQEKFPEAALRQAGYGAVWHGQKSWNRVAILARGTDPIETTHNVVVEQKSEREMVRATKEVIARIHELARRAGLKNLPAPIDVEYSEVSEGTAP